MRTGWVVVLMVAGLGAGVAPASAQAPAPTLCPPVSGTLGGLEVLRHVTATAEAAGDRVVFEFGTLPAPPAPLGGAGATFAVGPATPPFAAGASGKPLPVAGQSFASVALRGAYLSDPVRAPPSLSYAGPTDLNPGTPILAEALVSDSFEGHLTWILGLRRLACWQVTQLASPVRLVVDLRPVALPVTGPPAGVVPLGLAGLSAVLVGIALLQKSTIVCFTTHNAVKQTHVVRGSLARRTSWKFARGSRRLVRPWGPARARRPDAG